MKLDTTYSIDAEAIYISGSYSADTLEKIEENVKKAAEVAYSYVKEGWIVFCPHTHSHSIDQWFNDGTVTWEVWLIQDIHWIAKCDAIHMLPGWRNSKGAQLEYMVAQALGLKILGALE